jgi:hypothetical protein
MIKIIGAVCLGKEPRICSVFGQILILAVSISILCILAMSCSKISLLTISSWDQTDLILWAGALAKLDHFT